MPRWAIWGGSDATTVDAVADRVRDAAGLGLDAIWFPQTASLDVLSALAVAGREVEGIALGTAVVPIQGRHPIPLAQQALTVADAVGPGRLTLGIGVTHAPVSEGWYGIPYRQVVALCREELQALQGLLGPEHRADVVGEHLTARITLPLTGPPPGLVVAALGPKMLELAGRFADGTVTWMTGPRTLARSVVPGLRRAADAAGRPEPRVIVGLPVCVTSDPDGARERLAPVMAGTAQMASYRRMVDAEGVGEPVDLALVGDVDAVGERLVGLVDAGATEVLANVVGDEGERARTRALLQTLAAGA